MGQLYKNIFYSKYVDEVFEDNAMIIAMLRFESALAAAQAKFQIIPSFSAKEIQDSCRLEFIDVKQLIEEAGTSGNIAIPLIKQLTATVQGRSTQAAKSVHYGVTSQDVIDSALMMQLKAAFYLINKDLQDLISELKTLAEKYRSTVMVGRTFMQQARPITFGFKILSWLEPLVRCAAHLEARRDELFVLQLGGAVGSLPAMKAQGFAIMQFMGNELNLAVPVGPWHTQRDRLATLSSGLGILAGNLGKMAKDISLLAQTEINEVRESSLGGRGGSSSMPQKRNPVGCIGILANAIRVPGLVSTVFSSLVQDHERATGLWHAEWESVVLIARLAAGAVAKALEVVKGLEVDQAQMLLNLEATRGAIFAENVATMLAQGLGKKEAHELLNNCVKEASLKNLHLREVCLESTVISSQLSAKDIEDCFDSNLSVGMCEELIDRALNREKQ